MKGYWLAQVDVSDPEAYKAYVAANAVAFRKYGARFLVRAGRHRAVEGGWRSRLIVIEFPDYETALACYASSEYQRAMKLRLPCAAAEVVIVEGYAGAQPCG
jgi:uncharacterized protein (DUF1330 family)